MGTLFNTGLLIRPATKISELSINTDKSWALNPATGHSPAWATGLSAFTQRKRFSLYGTTRKAWYDVNWLYRKEFSVRQTDTDVCTGGVASASSYYGVGYEADKAFDNNFTATKWATPAGYSYAAPSWIKYDLGAGNEKTVVSYTITSGDDAPTRDPMNWTFEGSNDNVNWTVLDTQIGQSWSSRLQTKVYGPFINLTAYRYYRLNISANHGSTLTQITEVEFCQDTPALDDYQVWLQLTRASGTDTGSRYYLDTDVLATFADIRFTDQDGNLLNHWIEAVSGSDCYVWVKIPSLPCKVFLYYGNAAAPDISNGTNTFILFDDFERGVNGDPIGGAWTVELGAVTISTDHAYGGTRSAKFAGAGVFARARIDFPAASNSYNIRIRYWKETAVTSCYYLIHSNGVSCITTRATTAEDLYYKNAADAWVDTTKNTVADAWRLHEFLNIDFAAQTWKWYEEGVLVISAPQMRPSAEATNQIMYANFDPTAGHDIYIDNLIVRKWNVTEPVTGIAQQREIQALPTTLYPMMLTVHYGSGTDSPSHVYLGGLGYPDFRDIRFTNSAGTKLHYFIDNYVESDYATVWILFDTVPGAGATLNFWLYYGYSLAITESSLLNTFPLFSDGPYSGVLDAARWLGLSGTWDISAITDHWGRARNSIRQSNVAGADYAMQTVPDILGDNLAIDCWSRGTAVATAHGVSLRCADNNNYYSGHHGGFADQRALWKRVAAVNTPLTIFAGARDLLWHRHSLRVNGTRLNYIQDDGDDLIANDGALPVASLKLALSAYGAAAAAVYFTDVRVRPYYYQEPIFGGWTVPETYATFYGITEVKELAAAMNKGDMLVSDGTNLAIVTPSFVGTNLVAKDPGNLPVWEYPP